MLLAVPTAHDEIGFNSNRLYGPLQMSHVLANWEQIHANLELSEDKLRVLQPDSHQSSPGFQPGIVVQKKRNKPRNVE